MLFSVSDRFAEILDGAAVMRAIVKILKLFKQWLSLYQDYKETFRLIQERVSLMFLESKGLDVGHMLKYPTRAEWESIMQKIMTSFMLINYYFDLNFQ